jgi:hypothetical protein
MRRGLLITRFALLVCAALLATAVKAHTPEFSYVWLQVNEDGMQGRLEAATADIYEATNIRVSAAAPMTGETEEALKAYFGKHLVIGDDNGSYPLEFTEISFLTEIDDYLVMQFVLDSPQPPPEAVVITYSAIMHALPEHRGGFHFENNYLTGVVGNHTQASAIHAPGRETVRLSLFGPNRLAQFGRFILEGIEHIWIGLDHVLFLVTLLLTSVLVRKDGSWQPTDGLKSALWNVVAIVTVFTVAHSITLALAMKGWISLPSRFVESMIALSILIVVVDNIHPILGRFKWSAVFVFGLFHGMGFASVLEDLTFDRTSRYIGLIGFNIGVELGQLVIVLVLFPVFFLIRRFHYENVVLRPASLFIGLLAVWWIFERALDLPSGWTSF